MRDVMCSGYVAGCNTAFFGCKAKKMYLDAPADSEDVVTDISSRLSQDNEEVGEYRSMLAFACGYGDGAKRDQVISITDRLLPWEVSAGEGKKYFPGGKDNWEAYKGCWGLSQIHFGEDVRAAENADFISQARSANLEHFPPPPVPEQDHRSERNESHLDHSFASSVCRDPQTTASASSVPIASTTPSTTSTTSSSRGRATSALTRFLGWAASASNTFLFLWHPFLPPYHVHTTCIPRAYHVHIT